MSELLVLSVASLALVILPMPQASAAPIDSSPYATWQTNGRVRTVQYSPDGSVVFMAGEFTSVRPPGSPLGSNEVTRNHAAAFDAATGDLLAWNPNLDGNVWSLAVSPDGQTVYMGGDFLNIGGQARERLVAVDTTTGSPTPWHPGADGRVRVIVVSPDGTRVYVGGEFGKVNGTPKQLVAAIDTVDRALVSTFTASVTQYTNDTCPPRCTPVVASLALSPDASTLYIGGHFGLIDGQGPINNAGSVDAETGALVGTWNPNVFHRNVLNRNQKNTVYAILPYQDHVFICGDFANVGGAAAPNLASTLATDGSLDTVFKAQDDGGTPACAIGGSLLYIGGHFLEADGVPRLHIAAVDLTTGALDPWNPSANSDRGLHAFATFGSGQSFKLGVGGDFTRIGAANQQGFAQFTLPQELQVSKSGAGDGSVTSSPSGIDCGATCSATFNGGTLVTLTATPDATSTFTGWSGAGCSGTGTCQVTMDQGRSVTATFGAGHLLQVAKSGTGGGSVVSSPPGIDCGATCSAIFGPGTPVTLTATADADSLFAGWSGEGCSGTGTCHVTLDQARSVTATFTPSTFALTISKTGAGTGSVTSSPSGIDCGATCSAAFNGGTLLTLTATPDATSTFTGWSGAGCSGTGTCQVTMDQARSVTASFGTDYRPDGQLSYGAGAHVGNNIYNTTGASQVRAVRSRRGRTAIFHWKIQNDGALFDRIVFAARGNSPGFRVSFYLGSANVTKAVVAGTYARNLAAGTSLTITVKITVLRNARVGRVKTEMLRATSMHQPVSDVVLARVTASK